MPLLLDYTIHEAVAADGLPRVADYDDGTQQVLFLGGAIVQSMSTADWLTQRGPLPADPTPQQSADAVAARAAAQQAQTAKRAALRTRARTIVSGAVGVDFAALTNAQLLGLVKVMAHRLGAFDDDGLLRHYDEWREP
jgi:hypothetical protein